MKTLLHLLGLTAAVVAVVGTAAPAAPAPTAPAPDFLPAAEVVARAQSLPLDERRQLVYLYARLNQPAVAEALAEQILAANPRDRQTLLVLASMHAERKDSAAVLRLARRYLEFYPDDHQGLYFLAAGHLLAQQPAEARRVLLDLKRAQFAAERFPYETDLAAAAAATGDWPRALRSYQELLRHHPLADEARADVRRALDAIYREHLPRLEAAASALRLEQAQVWRYSALHGRHLGDRHWLDLRAARDDVRLDAAPGLRTARADRAEAVAVLTTNHDPRWRSQVSLGAGRVGLVAGAGLRCTFAPDRSLALELATNERATDSLALEALDGRQHRAALVVGWRLVADLAFSGRFHARELQVAGSRLGRATGCDLNLDQTLWRQGPQVVAGYRGSLGRFSLADPPRLAPAAAAPIADPAGGLAAQRGVIANLVNRRLNRHGTGLLVAAQPAPAFAYRFTAGVDYDFELESTGWNVGLALSVFPRRSLELSVEGGYTSSASASNAGSAATLLNFFVRSHY